MEITRESIAHGVYEPKALSIALVHTPFATGWQYEINGSKAIFGPISKIFACEATLHTNILFC